MRIADRDAALEARLEALIAGHQGLDPAELVEIVECILGSAQGGLSQANLKLYDEIEALSRYIQTARAEIFTLRPEEITDEHLPVAGQELEAIVGATEKATNAIIEAVETIETEAAALPPELAQRITDAVTQVYEACSFQDITGQRITKVVNCLRLIEVKVQALLKAFDRPPGEDCAKAAPAEEAAPQAASDADPDRRLMNGPQNPDDAISQDDIDALLASFD